MAKARGLTEGEIELARSVYGDAIDYDEVEIHGHSHIAGVNIVQSPNGNIYYPKDDYEDDFSATYDFGDKSTFIHEMGHVLQNQNGISVGRRVVMENTFGGHPRGDYDWTDKFEDGKSFHKWDLEEQAQFFADIYRVRLDEDSAPPGITAEEMEAYFKTLDLKTATHKKASLEIDGGQADIQYASHDDSGAGLAVDAPAVDAPARTTFLSAAETLAADARTLDAAHADGSISPAFETLSDPEFRQVFKALADNDIDTIDANISPDMDIDTRVEAIAEASRGAAREAGIEVETPDRAAHHGAGGEPATAEDDYSYGIG